MATSSGFLQVPHPSRGFNAQVTPIGARVVDPKTDIEWLRVKAGDGITGSAWRPVSDDLFAAHNEALEEYRAAHDGNDPVIGDGSDTGNDTEGTDMARTAAAAAAPARGGRRRARAQAEDNDNIVNHPTRKASGGRRAKAAPAPAKAGRAKAAVAPAQRTAKAAPAKAAPVKRTAKAATEDASRRQFTHCKNCGWEFKHQFNLPTCKSAAGCAARKKAKDPTLVVRGRQAAK